MGHTFRSRRRIDREFARDALLRIGEVVGKTLLRIGFVAAVSTFAATTSTAQQATVIVEPGLMIWDTALSETFVLEAKQSKAWYVELNADEKLSVQAKIEKNWASPPSVAICSLDEFNQFRKSGQLLASCANAGTMQSTTGLLTIAPGKRGVYYAVILNGRYAKRTAIEASVKVQRPFKSSRMRQWPDALTALNEILHSKFKGFQFVWAISDCDGRENAFYSPAQKAIVLCTPIVDLLRQSGTEPSELGQTLLFVLLHEVGHGLLDQWKLPGNDNEEMADEMGAVLLLEFSEGGSIDIGSAVRFWQAQAAGSVNKAEVVAYLPDTHPLPIQRARKLATVAENYGDYALRWQRMYYNFVTTKTLESRARGVGAHADAKLARSILETRVDSTFYARNERRVGTTAVAEVPRNIAKLIAGIRSPMRREEIKKQPFLVALISDYESAVGDPVAFLDAVDSGKFICLSLCRDGEATKVEIGEKITASDFIKMMMTTRYGATENAANRWAALERIDAVVAKIGADSIPLTQEDVVYFSGPFATLVAKSEKMSGRKYESVNVLIARALRSKR